MKFKLDAGGGRRMEYLLAGALGLVIVGSLVLTIIYAGGGGATKQVLDSKIHVKCTAAECGYEWALDPEDPAAFEAFTSPGKPGEVHGLDCPKCGAKGTGLLMIQCPNCKTFFLSENAKNPGGPKVADICPKCHTDRDKWFLDRAKHR